MSFPSIGLMFQIERDHFLIGGGEIWVDSPHQDPSSANSFFTVTWSFAVDRERRHESHSVGVSF
jgi:hypothetical protein